MDGHVSKDSVPTNNPLFTCDIKLILHFSKPYMEIVYFLFIFFTEKLNYLSNLGLFL